MHSTVNCSEALICEFVSISMVFSKANFMKSDFYPWNSNIEGLHAFWPKNGPSDSSDCIWINLNFKNIIIVVFFCLTSRPKICIIVWFAAIWCFRGCCCCGRSWRNIAIIWIARIVTIAPNKVTQISWSFYCCRISGHCTIKQTYLLLATFTRLFTI